MSWEDIEEARVKRAAKEQAAADKRDRGQQRRAAKEQATTDKGKRARKRKKVGRLQHNDEALFE
jgi:hypothetical protein